MINEIISWIKRLFGIEKTITSTKMQKENRKYTDDYLDISKINFRAIFASKLATLAVSDSLAIIEGDNKRAELLKGALGNVWKQSKKIIDTALGTGGAIIIPYVNSGEILFDIVKQSNIVINAKSGNKITSMSVVADTLTKNTIVYYRIVNYTVENGTLYIVNKAVSQYGAPANVDEWASIRDIAISNVDRVPAGFIKCPVDNRKNNDYYGVPITYGCDKIIEDIYTCLEQIQTEFKRKEVRLQVDERAFDKDPKTGKPILRDSLFMKGRSDDGSMFNIFDPEIRESSYYNHLNHLFELFEKQVGTSRGILTVPETHGATATEIKAAMHDTFALVTNIRKAAEDGINDFLIACDVLANYYSLTPPGEYKVVFDWDYSMIENSDETWQQLIQAQSIGVRSKAELRAWQTGESIEEAQAAIDDIAAKEPDMQTLMGMN